MGMRTAHEDPVLHIRDEMARVRQQFKGDLCFAEVMSTLVDIIRRGGRKPRDEFVRVGTSLPGSGGIRLANDDLSPKGLQPGEASGDGLR